MFLQVPTMAVPRLTHRRMLDGVATTDCSTAWDFGVCGGLGEDWVLLVLPDETQGGHQRVRQ